MVLSVSDILELTAGRFVNQAELDGRDSEIQIQGPSVLRGSRSSHVAFFFNKNYQGELPEASPGVLITAEPFVEPLKVAGLPLWKQSVVIACADPYLAMARLSEKLAEGKSASGPRTSGDQSRIHSTAIVQASAQLGHGVEVGPHCVIEEGVVVGDHTKIGAGSFIGPGVEIGSQCHLFPRVTVYEWAKIGSRVRLHSGCVIGSDGFGYAPVQEQGKVIGHQKIYHLGRVLIGDDVEIGANSCVDRGTMGDTIIENQAKLDNVVHVGHNARIEQGAVLCGGICLAGRAVVGKFAYVGGMTGVVNDVRIGDGAQVAALTLVSKDVPAGTVVAGNPLRDHKEHFQAHALLSRLLKDRKRKS